MNNVVTIPRPSDQPRCLQKYVERLDDRLAYTLWRLSLAQARPQHVDICMQARNQLKIRSRSALESLERGFPLTEAQERLIGAAGRDWPNMAPCNWRSRDW